MSRLTNEALALLAKGFRPHVLAVNAKRPLAPGWQMEADWTKEAVASRFDSAPAGHGLGLRADGLVIIDVDGEPGATSLARLEGELGSLPATVKVRTRSGGVHLYFRLPVGVVLKNTVKGLDAGVDTRTGPGGQVVAPPTVVDGAAYSWAPSCSPDEVEVAPLPPAWLAALQALEAGRTPQPAPRPAPSPVRSPVDIEQEAERRRRYMATLTEPSIQGQGGNAVMMRAAFHAKEMSRDLDEAYSALADWSGRKASPPWTEYELRRALENSEAVLGAGLDRNRPEAPKPAPDGRLQFIAYVQPTSRFVAQTEDGASWALDAGMDAAAARRVLIASGIEKDEAKRALEDHTVIHAVGVDTIPNAPKVVRRGSHDVLNAWIPPAIEPAPGPFPILDEVLAFVSGSPEGKAWLTNWMAAALQRPGERFRTAPILSGQQQTGKSVIIRALRALIGEGNSRTIRSEDITGRFSASFATALLVAVGEIETSDLDAAQGRLRYLTGEDRIMVEGKFAAAREVKNRLKLIGSTNKRDPVRVDARDTRWTILRQDAEAPADYLARVHTLFAGSEWSPRGVAEVRGLGHYLTTLAFDPDVVNVPLRNAARAEAVTMSRSSVERFADEVDAMTLDGLWMATIPSHQRDDPAWRYLDIPGRPGVASATAVYALYRQVAQQGGQQPVGAPRFGSELAEARPAWELLGQVGNDDRRLRIGSQKVGAWGNLPRDPALRQPGPIKPAVDVVPEPPTGNAVDDPRFAAAKAMLSGLGTKEARA